jgi:hypothetical protein
VDENGPILRLVNRPVNPFFEPDIDAFFEHGSS